MSSTGTTSWVTWLGLLCLMAPSAAAAVELVELVATERIEDRRPVGTVEQLAEGSQVFIYLVAQNREAPSRVRLAWFRNDRFVVADPVRVGTADRWRTWLRRRLRPGDAGAWRVEVQAADGQVLGAADFQVGVPQPSDLPVDLPQEAPNVADRNEAPAGHDHPPSKLPCRALINLRTSPPDRPPRHAVAELRFGAHAELDYTDGLVQRTERGLEVLWTLLREDAVESPHGRVDRQWDELWSLPLGGGAPQVRVALPATLLAPEAPVNEPNLRESNRLEVLSVLGPWVGLHAHLTGVADTGAFDRSRLLTLGNPNDLKALVGEGLVELTQQAATEAAHARDDRIVGVHLHDFRQAAFVVGPLGLEVWVRLLCCQQIRHAGGLPVRVTLHAPPPPVRPHTPDSKGVFERDGCAVSLDGPSIVARARPRDPFRVLAAPGLVPFGVVGVVWLDPAEPFSLEQVEAAVAGLLRTP